MLKHYFTLAFRHLKKRSLFAAINVLCLAIGISFSIVTLAYVTAEKAVSSSLKDASQQYLLKSKWKVKDKRLDITTLGPLAKTLKDEYPGLVSGYYRYNPVTTAVAVDNKYFDADVAIGDTTLVSLYGFTLLKGNPAHAFTSNNAL